MNPTTLEEIYRAKQERRVELAALPAEDKLRIMEKLQDMGHSMIAARSARKPVVSGQHFENEEITLDSKQFVGCNFERCTIKILGVAPFGLGGCTFDECSFVFEGSAQLTLQVLAMMYHNGFKELIEDVFVSVRNGVPPEIQWPQSRLPKN